MKNNLIIDNYNNGKMADFLSEYISLNSKLSFVSAFFTIYAYDKLKDKLNSINKLRFLFGEPKFIRNLDPDKNSKKHFDIQDFNLSLTNQLSQSRIARDCEEWIKKKVDIKSIRRPNFLHGKLYHIEDVNGKKEAVVGSSNFTVNGLGFNENPNYELNTIVDSKILTQDLKEWFDEIWNDEKIVVDVKEEVLTYLKQIYQNYSPEFIYYKTLYELFTDFLNDKIRKELEEKQTILIQSKIWETLYDFQKDGVKASIQKLEKYNGCILADSVGLGKTFVALGVIKYYESRNERVLVLTPKKLRENWTEYLVSTASSLNPFIEDKFNYTVLNHTDLRDEGKQGDIDLEKFNFGMFDLVVIDESHNFRNDTKGSWKDETKKKSRYEKLMQDVIQSGINTKVLLLSATPVNVHLKDLRNQIYFFSKGKNDAFKESLGIDNLHNLLANAQRQFTIWADPTKNPNRNISNLILPPQFYKLLDELTIARSRRHIEKYYDESMKKIGKFPTRLKPESIYSKIDLQNEFPSFENIDETIQKYKLSIFSPFLYLKKDKREEYIEKYNLSKVKNLNQEDRENHLIGMMKMNYLKRLESSINSFQISMQRTLNRINSLLEKIKNFQAKQQTSYEIELEEDEEDLILTGGTITYRLEDMEIEVWKKDLKKDKDNIVSLLNNSKAINVERDSKLHDLKNLILHKLQNPSTNKNGKKVKKVIVFSAFSDTANYLYDSLTDFAKQYEVHIALVVGSGENKTTFGNNKFQDILINFSPISKKRNDLIGFQKEEIDILIATDCISEGQNLQDCDYLINYDIHWNPVRVIQRFGRIDRLGSLNDTIQLVNFWPTDDLDKYIKLKNRVEARMALVDISATNEDNILQSENVEEIIDIDLKFRNQQILRLKEEVLDLEELSDSISLADFSLDDFRFDLQNYLNKHGEELKNSPNGIYAVTPNVYKNEIEKTYDEGVIFLFKNKNESSLNASIHPYHPFYLVYVGKDETIKYSYSNPKQILQVFKNLSLDRNKVYESLCKEFDLETEDGKNMQVFNPLLKAAILSNIEKVKSKNLSNLGHLGTGILIEDKNLPKDENDYELITWLVIKSEKT